jgi:hypothetical protein
MAHQEPITGTSLRTPRAAAVAGIAFSLLLGLALGLIIVSAPSDPARPGVWLADPGHRTSVAIALNLVPFAGIAFLWFIGVVRDRIGQQEDRFFATVFLGSGLLFVAMYWSGVAQLASLVADNRLEGAPPLSAETLEHARAASFSFMFVLGARAAAVFVFATSTIIWRSGTFPRWLAVVGFAIGLVMLVSLSFLQLVILLFPIWVFVVSAYVLRSEFRASRASGAEGR